MNTQLGIRGARAATAGILLLLAAGSLARADGAAGPSRPRTITDTSFEWPTAAEILRVLSLRDYNTRVVVFGSTILGIAAGVVGTFAYLRRRALMGDALSHATLPGIAAVFLLAGDKHLGPMILGAAASGVLGVLAVIGLRRVPRIREDAAIGIVLSVFFGAGMVLFSLIQQMKTGNEAGLTSFIYGKAAAMVARDAWLITGTAIAVIAASALLFKEFAIVCFDQEFAATQSRPVAVVDLLMMALVVVTTVVGQQAVGLILIIAMLIIPASAARFWTDRLAAMMLIAGLLGAVSGWLGATASALLPRLPTGAIIVLCAGGLFFISMLAEPRRGLVAQGLRRRRVRAGVGRQHLLRALAEHEERHGEGAVVPWPDLLRARGWSATALRRLVRRARAAEAVIEYPGGALQLSAAGRGEAHRVLRNHRLWEMYLIRYADMAPAHVDRDADEVEHVLSDAIVRELERAVDEAVPVPPSPHPQGAAP
jgi:manganese/zinc/iron transport system permease protein